MSTFTDPWADRPADPEELDAAEDRAALALWNEYLADRTEELGHEPTTYAEAIGLDDYDLAKDK
jgi:hypothetical protein